LRQLTLVALVAATLILAAAIPAAAAPNLYGTSGLIEVPDDVICPVGSISPAYHVIVNPGDSSNNLNFFTVETGIVPKLSISGGAVSDGGTEALVNAKYRLSPETIERPSITIGVVDAAAKLDPDNPGLYIAFAKNLTAAAEEVAGRESKPLRGYLGFGTGVLKGVFVGLNWTLTPKLSAMFEYLSSGMVPEDMHLNGGARLALTNELRLDVGLVDFKDFTAGISYNVRKF
jgi:hypothetical protein